MTTTHELIQRLAQYPPHTKVTIAVDWSEPIIDDSYQVIEGDPTITLKPSGWASEPQNSCCCESTAEASESVTPGAVERRLLGRLHEAANGHFEDAREWVHIYATFVR